MSGERRPDPDSQVRGALEAAKRERRPFDEAWKLATDGHVCDSYRSARNAKSKAADVLASASHAGESPPNLRASSGRKQCAGCLFVEGAGSGVARCGLYGAPVYSGVLWPFRTDDRHEWQWAIFDSEPEWRASYEDTLTGYSLIHALLAAIDEEEPIDLEMVMSGDVAA